MEPSTRLQLFSLTCFATHSKRRKLDLISPTVFCFFCVNEHIYGGVQVFICICVYWHPCVFVCVWKPEVSLGVPQELSTWFTKKSPGWVDWLAPGILPSLPPQCWGCNPPHRDVWAENGTEVLMLTQWVLYRADTPAPTKELYRVAWAGPGLTRKIAFPLAIQITSVGYPCTKQF